MFGAMSDEKPRWLMVRPPSGSAYERMRSALNEGGVRTVCSSSQCPNKGECWSRGHAAFMLLGDRCTRRCDFCAVNGGVPGDPDPREPESVADAIERLGIAHCVLTSVTRDDLPDRGAGHLAATVDAIRRRSPSTVIELLIPDMDGLPGPISTVVWSGPDIVGHNLETVRRLQPVARDPRAGYDISLATLARIKDAEPRIISKSSLMLGMGETMDEVREAMKDLREVGVDILSIGQYLRPKGGRVPVSRYVTPDEFKELEEEAYHMGFRKVASGPLVRSSYRAWEVCVGADG